MGRRPFETAPPPRTTRDVRLRHWDRRVDLRRQATRAELGHRRIGSAFLKSKAESMHVQADFPLSCVVALNDHFPERGDTAERDAARRDGRCDAR